MTACFGDTGILCRALPYSFDSCNGSRDEIYFSFCVHFNLFQIQSYENDVGILKSQVWEIGDKLLMAEREKKKLEEELSKRQIFLQSIGKQVIKI